MAVWPLAPGLALQLRTRMRERHACVLHAAARAREHLVSICTVSQLKIMDSSTELSSQNDGTTRVDHRNPDGFCKLAHNFRT